MRTRLGIVAIASMLVLTAFPMGALGLKEVELQNATDAFQTAGRDTIERVFWRSGFGPAVAGGPTVGGNAGAFTTMTTSIENLTSGTTPVGTRPIFLEYNSLANASYVAGTYNASDFATQRWDYLPAARATGAASLGAGAASNARLAGWLLRTNHYANDSQAPGAPLIGATDDDGILGLWLIEGLVDRVAALSMYGAYNGSALGAFNLTDAALNDGDGTNGWQLVPNVLDVQLSSDPEPLFQGFGASNNATPLGDTALLILGLSEIVALADPAGSHANLFDGDPFDGSLYANAHALLVSIIANNDAVHWDATAMTYRDGTSDQNTGDLALLVKALATAEGAVGASDKANVTAARTRAQAALAALGDNFGVYPATYDIAGPAVTGNFSTVTLSAQSAAIEAFAAAFRETGRASDRDAMVKAFAGLESALFSADTYQAVRPTASLGVYSAKDVGAAFGALRDVALTHEEPLAIWRLLNATDRLFTAPPLVMQGATHPPIIGASYTWNYGTSSYSAPTNTFGASASLLAAYEFLTLGPEFYAGVGGGVQTTLRASLLLHNATAEQVGASIDGLDGQIAALRGQLAALQASFDALNANVTAITDRLNLSLENETISAERIAGLQANLTALRAQLNNTEENLTTVQALFNNASTTYGDLQKLYNASSVNLTAALANATLLAGRLNQSIEQAEEIRQAMNTTNATRDQQASDLGYARSVVAVAVLGGIVAGVFGFWFLQRYVMTPKGERPAKTEDADEEPKKGSSKKDADEGGEDDEDGDD